LQDQQETHRRLHRLAAPPNALQIPGLPPNALQLPDIKNLFQKDDPGLARSGMLKTGNSQSIQQF
jgi:hypothetical protein